MFSEIFAHFKGKTVRTYIFHKLYGKQKLTICDFQPLCVKDKIGFMIGDQEIFLYCDEIESIDYEESILKINGTLQEIILEII